MRQRFSTLGMLLVRGILRRTGPRGVSLRATGAWELSGLWDAWTHGGLEAVHAGLSEAEGHGLRPVRYGLGAGRIPCQDAGAASGFKQSPYSDVKPAGGDVRDSRKLPREGHAVPQEGIPARKLWHAESWKFGALGWT